MTTWLPLTGNVKNAVKLFEISDSSTFIMRFYWRFHGAWVPTKQWREDRKIVKPVKVTIHQAVSFQMSSCDQLFSLSIVWWQHTSIHSLLLLFTIKFPLDGRYTEGQRPDGRRSRGADRPRSDLSLIQQTKKYKKKTNFNK